LSRRLPGMVPGPHHCNISTGLDPRMHMEELSYGGGGHFKKLLYHDHDASAGRA
jgi:hypothetical protein